VLAQLACCGAPYTSTLGAMNTTVPMVAATVTLLPELPRGRRIAEKMYRPHIVIGPTTQRKAIVGPKGVEEPYLGVCFWEGPEWLRPGVSNEVTLALMYYDEAPDAYAPVVPGATFTLREGGTIIGYGEVKHRT